MHYSREGRIPGSKIGSLDAKDVNYAIDQLAARPAEQRALFHDNAVRIYRIG